MSQDKVESIDQIIMKEPITPVTIPIEDLNILSEEIIENQATQNIGNLGHVSHGKSTLVRAISGKSTNQHQAEKERNITIKLGYANFKIYECPQCPRPECYQSLDSKRRSPLCRHCGEALKLIRHFSFVDCPGHDLLMATMLNGAAVMDSAILLIAANESVPQPQTAEHLVAAEIMGLSNFIIAQSKVDLVTQEEAFENYKNIKEFVHRTPAESSPVIPISCAIEYYNVDVLLDYLVNKVPVPQRDLKAPPLLRVIRSFDVNVPGEKIENLKGGVAGGTLFRGILKLGQEIEIRPGIVRKDAEGQLHITPIFSTIVSLYSEKNQLQYAVPGGLIAVGTEIDPTLTKADRLVGQVIGEPGKLPEVYLDFEIEYVLMRRLIGVKGTKEGEEKKEKIEKLKKGETLMVNVDSASAVAKVTAVKENGKKKLAKISLSSPCCSDIGEKISLSRHVQHGWRLIGCGTIVHGTPLPLSSLV